MKLTKEKYKCASCGKTSELVITRNRASFCPECYKKKVEKRRIMKEINKLLKI